MKLQRFMHLSGYTAGSVCTRSLVRKGHQCYTHNAADRAARGFAQLRCKTAFPAFPADGRCRLVTAFIAGHGSAALSTAIGIARAKKLKNEPGKVVVIVGDGAFTGGMVYEGMNNVSKLNNLIVILNDNKMSISKNVGQMANYLTKLRTDRSTPTSRPTWKRRSSASPWQVTRWSGLAGRQAADPPRHLQVHDV